MVKVVLDTNVIVSAHIKAGGLEDQVFRLALHEHVILAVSEPILIEYERVLKSEKFSFNEKLVKGSLDQIRKRSILVQLCLFARTRPTIDSLNAPRLSPQISW